MKVIKFGGTSVGTDKGLENVIKIVTDYAATGEKVAVVVSAFTKVTDALIHLGRIAAEGQNFRTPLKELEDLHRNVIEKYIHSGAALSVRNAIDKTLIELDNVLHGAFLVRELSPRTLDYIMSFGERLSAAIVTEILRQYTPSVFCLDAREVLRTDSSFGSAIVDLEWSKQNIIKYFKRVNGVAIITGFIGRGPQDETTTLGRGGSDYTAAIFGAALGADIIEIWTDVDGVMTADPRKVKKAFTVSHITYEEAMELSHFGAKVIYPLTMQPALDAEIPIVIRNTFNLEAKGTTISLEKPKQKSVITGITSISNIALFRVQGSGMAGVAGIAGRLFGALARKHISIILISQASSEHSICFAIDPKSADIARKTIEDEFALELRARYIDPVAIETNLSIIAAVGENMRRTPGISGKLFQALGKNGINIVAIAQGSSELNISVVVSNTDEAKAVAALHDSFFLSDYRTVNLFLVGPGSVGKTLLDQIRKHAPKLERSHQIKLKVVGLANRSKTLFNEDGIDLSSWKETLSSQGQTASVDAFVKAMKEANLPHSIFVDCTADGHVASLYKDVLSSSISIVTPNKKANSGPWLQYCELKETAKKANVKFFYETNVGAGLPVIGTLNDLINSGDAILKVEAVLSGTLSYIFNNYTVESSFSAIVRQAKEEGYTEPDPRDDLSGMDVMRKLLILAREMNLPLEEQDIKVESLVPKDCAAAAGIEEFFTLLSNHDEDFRARFEKDLSAGKVIRYIATIEQGKAQVSLQAVDNKHPFYSLSGSDNIISFTTSRYLNRPLVVKGPGAGVEVTAAGVFADIVWISTYIS